MWWDCACWFVAPVFCFFIRAHGVVVSHPLCMRKALGSIPSVSILCLCLPIATDCVVGARMPAHCQDSLAELSKALAQGASPQGRGFEPHSCHSYSVLVSVLCFLDISIEAASRLL